jgi:glutathione S-transferase
MSDYTLYYWFLPFRGKFVRAVLAFAGRTWTEAGDAKISQLMEGSVKAMPVPFMGPPVLVDHGRTSRSPRCPPSSSISVRP